MIYEFEGVTPIVHESSFVHPQACVLGDVIIGKDVYIGPFATLRGDFGSIEIKDGCNVQESCTVHMFPGVKVVLEESAHIGHGAIVHGAHIGRNAMVGMNAVVMDDVDVGEESIIGALAMVKAEMRIPPRSLVVGNPAKIIKQVSEDMVKWKTMGTEIYQALPKRMQAGLKESQASSKDQWRHFNPIEDHEYQIWKKSRKG